MNRTDRLLHVFLWASFFGIGVMLGIMVERSRLNAWGKAAWNRIQPERKD